jgi:hypothetical protein
MQESNKTSELLAWDTTLCRVKTTLSQLIKQADYSGWTAICSVDSANAESHRPQA